MTKKDGQDKPKNSGRYRKVEVRTWGDAKFRELSPIPPCGQGLWLFLITGPHTGPIPGLFRAGRAAMAEELGWDIEAFDKAFGEAFRQGMVEADFKARVMWIPKAITHNKPESPNVVKSWAAEFDLIPECDLKWKAFEALKASIHALGEAYGKAFDETFAKPSGKPSDKPLSKTSPNQEQEQEQEQEQDSSSLRSEETRADKPRSSRPKREEITLKAYLQQCREQGTKAVPEDHPVRAYCRDLGASEEMVQVAWCVFREDYTTGKGKDKRYKDWPTHFHNAIRKGWVKVWYTTGDGQVEWSQIGLQARKVLDERQRSKEAAHAA